MGLIKREWLKFYGPHERPQKFDQVIQSWDTANKASELANFSSCTTWGLKGDDIYLLNVYCKRLEFPELVRTVEELRRQFGATVVLVEEAASGIQLLQQLRDKGVYSIKAVKPEKDKVIRMHAQTPMIENGFVYLPREAHWLAHYVHELTTFPRSKHSDQVDSTSQALAWISEAGREPGILQYMREEYERLTGKREEPIRLKAPAGPTHVLTITGRGIAIPHDRIIEVTKEEASALLRAGWVQALE